MASLTQNLAIAKRGLYNYLAKKPLCVSFEVTYKCNTRCKHCHLGGPVPNEVQASPARFGELCRELSPLVAQISGGEPLLRKDLIDIIKELRYPGGASMVVVTTNGKLLTKERYYALRGAGVDEISLSLDFPDERHDEFRTTQGLFAKIEQLLRDVRDEQDKGIVLACVVQRQNFRDLVRMAELAREHEVKVSFSTYTYLRTEDRSWMVPREELPELRAVLDRLLAFKKEHGTVFTSEYVFERMIRYFETGEVPGCRAGERFLVVNPSGTLSPCGLILGEYKSQRQLIDGFLASNTCQACNTSIRANTEKPWNILLRDALRSL